jgi:disulfide oxidoreductase YuzD
MTQAEDRDLRWAQGITAEALFYSGLVLETNATATGVIVLKDPKTGRRFKVEVTPLN